MLTAPPVRAQEPQILCLDTGGHTGRVSGLAFYTDPAHPLERRLLSTGRDKSARLWRLEADQGAFKTFRYNSDANIKGEIVSSAFDPATHHLALGMRAASDKEATEILIVDVLSPDGRRVGLPLRDLKDSIVALAFSPDGKWLAACDSTGRGLVYDTAQWKSSKFTGNEAEANGNPSRSSGVDSQVQSLAFSPDSSQLAYVHRETIEFKSLVGKKHTGKISLKEPNSLLCVAWAKNNTLAAADFQRVYRWKNPENGDSPDKLPLNSNALCLAFDREGQNLAIGTDFRPEASAQVTIWPQDKADARQMKVNAPVCALAFSEQGDSLACGSGAGELHVWDFKAGQLAPADKRLTGIGKPVYHLAWSDDSAALAWKQQENAEDYALAFDLKKMTSTAVQDASRLSEGGVMQRDKAGDLEINAGAGGGRLTVSRPVISQAGKEEVVLSFGVGSYDKSHARAYAVVDAEPGYVQEYDASDPQHPRQTRRFAGYAGIPLSLCASPDGRYLAMGTTDQTIRLWSLKDGADAGDAPQTQTRPPLICLFMGSAQQWAAWNPQTGFYYASPLGDDIICYQFNTPDNAQRAEVVPVSTCHEPFSNLQCMTRLFEQASVAPARVLLPSERTLYQQIARRPVINAAAIVVTDISRDVAGTKAEHDDEKDIWKTTGDAVTLNRPLLGGDAAGVVWEFQNISTGRRSIMAREKAGADAPPNAGPKSQADAAPKSRADGIPAAAQMGSVKLTKGINTIRIVARNGNVSSVPQYIRVEKQGGEDKKGVLHILAIGVSKYKSLEGNSLDYADADAKAIASQFATQAPGLYARIETPIVLTNEGATRDGIRAALDSIKVEEDDTLVFFIAGHGMPGQANTQDNPEFYFAPYDLDAKQVESTGLGWKYLLTKLAGLNARHSLLFVDHCFAGGIGSILKNDASQGQNKRRATDEVFNSLKTQSFITFMASGPDEESNESHIWNNHGAFTYALLNALQGARFTASSENGTLSVRDLDNQLGIEMKKALRMLTGNAKGTQQTPCVYAPFTSEVRDLPVIKYQ